MRILLLLVAALLLSSATAAPTKQLRKDPGVVIADPNKVLKMHACDKLVFVLKKGKAPITKCIQWKEKGYIPGDPDKWSI